MNWFYASENSNLPVTNSEENDRQYSIEVASPGFKKDVFKVNYDNDLLTISSEKKTEQNKPEIVTRRGFSYHLSNPLSAFPEMLKIQMKSGMNMRMIFIIAIHPKGWKINPSTAKEINIL